MALLFATLPASSFILGAGGFDGAAEIALFCFIVGSYLHIVGRPGFRAIPDAATILDEASRAAAGGNPDEAIALLTKALELTPRLWQAFQYRGQLYLCRPDGVNAALLDFNQAIRLAPNELHLYLLRGQALRLLGDEVPARMDFETAAALGDTKAEHF
jgi:tetratricopeptide (TPR) repeat protein